MVNALEQLAQLAPLALAGFGKRTETADRVMGIQEYQKQLDEKERVKKAGREIIELSVNNQDGFNADAIMAVAKKYDAPFEPLLQTMVAFKQFQKMGQPEPRIFSKLLPDSRIAEAELLPEEAKAGGYDIFGKVHGTSNEIPRLNLELSAAKHNDLMDYRNKALKALSDYRGKALGYREAGLSEAKRHNLAMESRAGGEGGGIADEDKRKKWAIAEINKRVDDQLKVIGNSLNIRESEKFMRDVLATADKERRKVMAGEMPEWLSPEGETAQAGDALTDQDRMALEEIRKALQ